MAEVRYNRGRLYPEDEISLRMGSIYVRFPMKEIRLAKIVIDLLLSEKLDEERRKAHIEIQEAPKPQAATEERGER